MLVIFGKEYEVPGVEGTNFLRDPKVAFTDKDDWNPRKTSWVRSVCLHTRMGLPLVLGGFAPKSVKDWSGVVAARHSRDDRKASWHISIDADGSYACHLDLGYVAANHAGQVNDVSIGIEMYQTTTGLIYRDTFDSCIKILEVICEVLRIPRMCTAPNQDSIMIDFAYPKYTPFNRSRKLAHMAGGKEGREYAGVFGHRNATRNRGKGDPGNYIFELLSERPGWISGLHGEEYKQYWKTIQRDVCKFPLEQCDGIPGPKTQAVLQSLGKNTNGL